MKNSVKRMVSVVAALLIAFTLLSGQAAVVQASQSTELQKSFVTRMYEVVLGREPDDSGLNHWADGIASGKYSAADIVLGFFESKEYAQRKRTNEQTIDDFYQAMLGREADSAGKANWVKYLNIGMSVRAVANGFVQSKEFKNLCAKYDINPGTVTITRYRDRNYNRTYFVYRMYQNCLGRTPDSTGLENWCKKLTEGTGAAVVAKGFVFSEEYTNKGTDYQSFINMLYRAMFGREADTGGYDHWYDALTDGTSRKSVFNGFVQSAEFANMAKKAGVSVMSASEKTALLSQTSYYTGFVYNKLVSVALSQVGNVNGQIYWSWVGFSSRVEWCGCFVSWCAAKSGLTFPKSGSPEYIAQWFQDNGKWEDASYTPKSGDIIFYDYASSGDGIDHMGIVWKYKDGIIYTVEGNVSNSCGVRYATVGAESVEGYGILY